MSRYSKCRKCSGVNISMAYQPSTDTLKRQCQACGFVWEERPDDYVETQMAERQMAQRLGKKVAS